MCVCVCVCVEGGGGHEIFLFLKGGNRNFSDVCWEEGDSSFL